VLIIIPVSENDFTSPLNVINFLSILRKFGPYDEHELLVSARPTAIPYAKVIFNNISELFKKSNMFVFEENGPYGWPQGPNYYWKHTIQHLKDNNNKLPWLWMEVDLLPLKPKWADILEKEYKKCGKPFFGTIQDTTTVTSDMFRINIARHLQGTAVYPAEIWKHCSIWEYTDRLDKAFDVITQWEIVPRTADTKLIQQGFRTINYKLLLNPLRIQGEDNGDMNGVVSYAQPIAPEAILHHGCKDTSLAEIIMSEDYKMFLK
jgi:hypothetical protein